MDYTDRDDLRQMLVDIMNRKNKVRKRDVPFVNLAVKKFQESIDLSYEESERLVSIWEKATEEW